MPPPLRLRRWKRSVAPLALVWIASALSVTLLRENGQPAGFSFVTMAHESAAAIIGEEEEDRLDHGRDPDAGAGETPLGSSSSASSASSSAPPPPASLLVLCTADGSLYAIDAWTGQLSSTIHTEALLQRSSHNGGGGGDDDRTEQDGNTNPDLDVLPPDTSEAEDAEDGDGDNDMSYPSGSILPGLDGNLYYWLENASNDDDDNGSTSGDVVGGGGELTQLPLTMEGLLERPVQTCGSDVDEGYDDADLDEDVGGTSGATDQDCGILTATLDTSLLAINERGEMLWQSASGGGSPTTASTSTHGGNDPKESQHTLVLQRKDYHVRQVSTATGQQVWNATLGTWHALDFSSVEDEYDNDDSDDNAADDDIKLLLTDRVQDKRETLEEDALPLAAHRRGGASSHVMPSIIFSTGKEILAVHPTTRTVLWKLEADSVVATVFGIHKGRWKPLNVMREEDLQLEGRVSVNDHQPTTLLLLDGRPASPTSSTARQAYRDYYDAPLMHWFEHYRSKQRLVQPVDGRKALPASSSDVAEMGIDPNGQQLSSNIRYCSPGRLDCPSWQAAQLRLPAPTSATTDSNPSNAMKEAPSGSVTMVQPDGLLLSWRIVTIMLALVIYAVVLGRIWYLHKKQSWLHANGPASQETSNESTVQAPPFAHSRSLEAPLFDRRSSSADASALRRSISLPDAHQHLVCPDPSPSFLLNKSDQALLPVHEGSPSGAPTSPVSIPNGLSSIPTGAPATSGEDSTSTTGGTGAAIPLVRYSRYASEYMELGALGKGGFGSVYQCKNVLDGREYAIKKVSIRSHKGDSDSGFEQRLERTLREVKILAVLDHPNIVRYFGAWLEIEKEEAVDEMDGDSSIRGFSRCYSSSMITESASQRPSNLNRNHLGGRMGQDMSEDSGSYAYNPPPRQPFFSRRIPLDDCGFIFEESEEEEDRGGQSDPGDDTTGGNQASHRPAQHCVTPAPPGDRSEREEMMPSISARPETGPPQVAPPSPPRIVRHTLYIQMQLCSHRTVGDFLSDPASRQGSILSTDGAIDIPMALRLFLQIAHAVRHVHDQGLIHRDLKPQNCFMDDSGNVKVGDFGLSRESADTKDDSVLTESVSTTSLVMPVGDDHTAGVGTRAYASPEQMNGSAYDSSTDVYSLGIILFELVYPMYTGMERNICLSRLRQSTPALPKDWEMYVGSLFPSLRDLVLSMVSYDASRRPTAASVAQHVQSILNEFTIVSLDDSALHRQDIILLRVEAQHSPDALSQTIRAIEETATDTEHQVQVVQYGLRSSNAVAIMEFALEYTGSGTQLVTALCDRPSILKVRQVSTGPHLAQQNMQYLAAS